MGVNITFNHILRKWSKAVAPLKVIKNSLEKYSIGSWLHMEACVEVGRSLGYMATE